MMIRIAGGLIVWIAACALNSVMIHSTTDHTGAPR
jgi:hypothetical protein